MATATTSSNRSQGASVADVGQQGHCCRPATSAKCKPDAPILTAYWREQPSTASWSSPSVLRTASSWPTPPTLPIRFPSSISAGSAIESGPPGVGQYPELDPGLLSGNMNSNYWGSANTGSAAADTAPHVWINGATARRQHPRLPLRCPVAKLHCPPGTGSVAPTAGLMLGGGWSGAEKSDGDIAELFVFDHQLTTTEERQQLEGLSLQQSISGHTPPPFKPAPILPAPWPVELCRRHLRRLRHRG